VRKLDLPVSPNKLIFKFRDDATGLFWMGKLTGLVGPLFTEQGVEYRSQKGADDAFRYYEVARRTDRPTLPVLSKLTYEVVLNCLSSEGFEAEESAMRLCRFMYIHGVTSRITKFVRALSDNNVSEDFSYVVQRANHTKGRTNKTELDLTPLNDARLSSRKTGHQFVAVRTDADLLYLKMALGEDFAQAFDMKTGLKI
jgi:hypothetical protein